MPETFEVVFLHKPSGNYMRVFLDWDFESNSNLNKIAACACRKICTRKYPGTHATDLVFASLRFV